MFAIAFDLVVADTEKPHPKGVSQAYTDIATALERFGFRPRQYAIFAPSELSNGRILRP